MRAILRVGIITGVCALVALSAAARLAPLAAVIGVVATGLAAGLGAAKWLEWTWYGRQLGAGWRTGAIACGLAGAGTLASLVVAGPHDIGTLAAQSRWFGVDLGPYLRAVAGLGWQGLDVALVLASAAVGVLLAAGTTLVFAAGKSARAVEVIAAARKAALASARSEPLNTPLPAPTYPAIAGPAGDTLWPAASQAGMVLAPDGYPPTPSTALPAPTAQIGQIGQIGQPAPDSGRGTSTARPVENELNADEREALARWAEEHADDTSGPRSPAPSTYLNSPSPAPKRSRKKQHTRDWLC